LNNRVSTKRKTGNKRRGKQFSMLHPLAKRSGRLKSCNFLLKIKLIIIIIKELFVEKQNRLLTQENVYYCVFKRNPHTIANAREKRKTSERIDEEGE